MLSLMVKKDFISFHHGYTSYITQIDLFVGFVLYLTNKKRFWQEILRFMYFSDLGASNATNSAMVAL